MLEILATRRIPLSRDSFAKIEIELLEEMGWLVHPPSSMQFVNECIGFVHTASALDRCGLMVSARWLCEQHVYSGAVTKKPSAVGIAAILCSLENDRLHRVPEFIRDVQTIPGLEDLSDSDDFIDACRYFRDIWQLYCTPRYHGMTLPGLDTTAAVFTSSVIEEDGFGSSDMTPLKRAS